MAGEHSPVLEEAVGGEAEVPRKVVVTDLSFRGDTTDRFRVVIKMRNVGSWIHVNLRKAMTLGPRS
jgi:hypothetical protein